MEKLQSLIILDAEAAPEPGAVGGKLSNSSAPEVRKLLA